MPTILIRPTDGERTLDRAVATFRDPGTEIVLAPGEYWTGGAWAHGANWERMQAPGVKLRVDNGAATIRLADWAPRSLDASERPEHDLRVWTYGHRAEISDITFDGRESSFPDRNITAGVRGVGSSRFRNLRVTGLRGTPGTVEAFGFSCTGPEGGTDWDGLTVEKCAPASYVSPFNVGHVGVGGAMPPLSTLRKCFARPGAGNWMGYGVNENAILVDCDSEDVIAHVYNDTGPTRCVYVNGGTATRAQKLLSLVIKPGPDAAMKTNVTMRHVSASLVGDNNSDARVVELWNQTPNSAFNLGNVAIIDAAITSTAMRTYAWAVAAPGNVSPVVFVGSRLPPDFITSNHPCGCIIQ